MSSLELRRAALRARQHEVTAALLSGDHPVGFDQQGAEQTTRVLLGKRANEVAAVCPELTDLPGWRRHFAHYAATHHVTGCAHTQMTDFTSWMRTRPGLSAGDRGWLAVADVHASRKRTAFARIAGRHVLLLGWGQQVRVIPLSARRRLDQGG